MYDVFCYFVINYFFEKLYRGNFISFHFELL